MHAAFPKYLAHDLVRFKNRRMRNRRWCGSAAEVTQPPTRLFPPRMPILVIESVPAVTRRLRQRSSNPSTQCAQSPFDQHFLARRERIRVERASRRCEIRITADSPDLFLSVFET